jgi:peptidoglycan glycosyltransferase
MMKHIKPNIRKSFFILMGLFILLTIYFYYNMFLYSDRWFSDPNNTRIRVDMSNPSIIPGNIQDRNGKVMVETKSSTNKDGTVTYYRSYDPDSSYAAHVIGSKKYGIGAEVLYVRHLLGYDNNLFERIYQKAFLDQEVGNNVILTIDMRLQKFISQAMGSNKGSVVLINPINGEILAMVSKPSFNPARDEEELQDESLLNKGSYGRYPPGSVMKVVTAAAALESIENIEEYTVECNGSTEIGGVKISCYGQEAHGKIKLRQAMEISCNAYFAQLSLDLGWKALRQISEDFGFNKDFLFPDIKITKSILPITRNTDNEELTWSSIGQGKVLATPLHMALIASSVANEGAMPEPRLIHAVQDRKGNIHLQPQKNALLYPITTETAKALTNIMVSTVENGTGNRARIPGMLIAGKTGTAETTEEQAPHAWFVGFAPADKPSLAIAIILENAGTGGGKAAPLAGEILKEAARLGY